MTAVVFGGSGFIGHHLVRWLAEREEEVVIADIATPQFELAANVRFERCDVREPIALEVAESPAVYNLAAVHRSPGHADDEYFDTNVPGARNVVAFCESRSAQLLVFTSSISVYGPSEEPVTEAADLRSGTAYGRSKIAAEELHTQWVSGAGGRRLVIVRAGSIFGEGEQGNFTRLARAIERHTFAYPGRRDTRKACGYVTDLIGSLAFAQDLAEPVFTYNFGFPTVPSTEEVCRAMAEVGGFARPRLTIPESLLLVGARALSLLGAGGYDSERVMKLAQSTNVVPARLIEHGYAYRFDLRGALEDWFASSPAGRFV